MIKIVAPRMAQNVVDRAMQVCLELQQFYTRALAGNALLKCYQLATFIGAVPKYCSVPLCEFSHFRILSTDSKVIT